MAVEYIKKFEGMKAERINWDSHWEECAQYVLPRKDDVYRSRRPGEKKYSKVYESTPIHSNELLSSALHSMLTNSATNWFELTTGDVSLDMDDDVRLWLQETVKRMHNVINGSNFHTHIHELYVDLGVFGTGLMRIEEDDDEIIRVQTRPIYEAYIREDAHSKVNTVYRVVKLDVRQIAEMFGTESFDNQLLALLETNDSQKFEVLHVVEPVDKGDEFDKKGFSFKSVYILTHRQLYLQQGGFKEFPYVVPRWTKIAGEVYGRSPAMKALADIKMTNVVAKTTMRSAEKVVDPPLLVPDDGYALPLKTAPGAITFYRPGSQPIVPLQTGSRVDFGVQFSDQINRRIREAFFIDQLQLNIGPQMTATEVAQRTEEKLRLLGPILGRQHYELLKPLVNRIFSIMMRKNLFPEIPEILQDRNIQVRYSSKIAKAQRSADADVLMKVMNILGPMVQLQPEIMDNVNGDQAIRYVSKAYGLPEQMLRPFDDVVQTRVERQEQQQQMEQMAQAQQGAEIASKAAPLMQQGA